MQQLNEDFLCELTKLCLKNQHVLDVCRKYLNYEYLPTESWKFIYKEIFTRYDLNNSVPTIGILSQVFESNSNIINLLSRIKNVNVSEQQDEIIEQLEIYVRKRKFQVYHKKLADLWNDGKQDEAFDIMEKDSLEVANFSIKEALYQRVFNDFPERQLMRKQRIEERKLIKIPTGIPQLDNDTFGGIELGYAMLIIMQSGVGKSTLLRWLGYNAARLGYNVAHFSAEGTEQQVMDAYDAGWTGSFLQDIKYGNIDPHKIEQIERARQGFLKVGGEIHVKCFEQFDTASIADCRKILIDWEKLYGKMHLVLFDYLDEFTPVNNTRYINSDDGRRIRKKDTAKKIVNIGTEFKCAVATATQASTVDPKDLNDPNFVMTRYNISELKATIDPFSYVITGNQTNDEYDKGVMRMYTDKLREYKAKSIYKIWQAREHGRFIDIRKTINAFT